MGFPFEVFRDGDSSVWVIPNLLKYAVDDGIKMSRSVSSAEQVTLFALNFIPYLKRSVRRLICFRVGTCVFTLHFDAIVRLLYFDVRASPEGHISAVKTNPGQRVKYQC